MSRLLPHSGTNTVLPAANLGGDAMRAYLIKPHIPLKEGVAERMGQRIESARMDMDSVGGAVELACLGREGFIPSAIEVEARERSYSILTLAKVKALHPGARLFFILGVDAFLEIGTWREYERVLDECRFIVTSRPGFDLEAGAGVLDGRLRGRGRGGRFPRRPGRERGAGPDAQEAAPVAPDGRGGGRRLR